MFCTMYRLVSRSMETFRGDLERDREHLGLFEVVFGLENTHQGPDDEQILSNEYKVQL